MQFNQILRQIFLYLFLFSPFIVRKLPSCPDLPNWCKTWFTFDDQNLERNASNLFSSVYCRGRNHTDRLCHFQNLCFDPKSKLFLFFHNTKSIMTGLPPNRFSPTLVDFSSVSDHNTQYFNYVELPSSATSKFKIWNVKGHALMFKRFKPDNLMHVFHDDLLPVFATINEIPSDDIFLIFADNRPPGPFAFLYQNFLMRKPLYLSSLGSEHIYCFQHVYIGLNKHSLWYQYGFKKPQGPLMKSHNEVSHIIFNFRDYFIKQFSLTKHIEKNTSILLLRRINRKILNEIELSETLSKFSGLETRLVNLEYKSILHVIQEIIHSQILVGMHGSLLILSLFLNPSSIVIELFPFGVDPIISTPYKTLSEMPGLKLLYRSWQNMDIDNNFPHPEYPKELGGIRRASLEEREEIQNSVVKPFLCCDNPVWLYRIYQDTVVDVQSFQNVLVEALESRQKLLSSSETFKGHGLFPSEVQNISCAIESANNTTLTFSWDKPWNLMFMDSTVVEYEMWIQDIETDKVQAFLMTKNVFKFPVKSETNIYYVWMRCYVDGMVGPFNSSPFICSWQKCMKT